MISKFPGLHYVAEADGFVHLAHEHPCADSSPDAICLITVCHLLSIIHVVPAVPTDQICEECVKVARCENPNERES